MQPGISGVPASAPETITIEVNKTGGSNHNSVMQLFRRRIGWTQDQMADYLDVTKQAIHNYEQGIRWPKLPLAFKLVALGQRERYPLDLNDIYRDRAKQDGVTL